MTGLVQAMRSAPPGTADLLVELLDGKERTRAELATLLGQSRSTIAAKVDALLELGLLAPTGQRSSTGGRPSAGFALAPAGRLVLAYDVGATHVGVGVVDLSGALLVSSELAVDLAEGPDRILPRITHEGRALVSRLQRDMDDVIGAGIGVPAHLRPGASRPIHPLLMPGWHDFDIGAWLRTDLDVPVHVDNDVNLMALGEQRSSWPDVQDLVFVKVATGIGAGIIAGGQLQRGAHGGAGDLGHIKLARGADVRCRCGNRGCLVALASGPAIADSLRAAGAQVASPQDVVDAVRAGNLEAIEAVRQAGRDIGEVLAMSVSLINPSVIALGGTMSQIEHLVVGVREEVYSRAMPLAAEGLQIVRSAAGSVAGLVGAGTLAVDHVIADLRSGRR